MFIMAEVVLGRRTLQPITARVASVEVATSPQQVPLILAVEVEALTP